MASGTNVPHIGWSSHVYPLDAADVARLPDYDGPAIPEAALPPDNVIVYIRPDGPDVLLRGRETIAAAMCSDPSGTVPVRIAFKPSVAKWNLAATIVRVLRNRYRYHGTARYHIAAATVRAMGLERAVRTLDNPQKRGKDDRKAQMEKLEKSLREHGYDDNRPIVVMLCRSGGKIDSVRQGHHRVSACLACGVEKMTVEFAAAGALPACFKRQQPADGRHNVSMVSIQPGELLGGGSRRTCHALPDPSLCLKSYRTDDELEEFSKKLAAKGATPLKPAVVREIHMNRFLRAKNTNVQEYEAWCSMKERLPSDVMSVFPSKMELVCDSVRGWSIVEERVRNFDGRPLTRISQEALHAAPQQRSRLLSAFCALRDDLSRHHVCFFDPPNVMVQWLTQDEFRLRIVDFEPAVRTLLPVDKLFPFLLAMKVRRRFNRWLRHIQESGFVV